MGEENSKGSSNIIIQNERLPICLPDTEIMDNETVDKSSISEISKSIMSTSPLIELDDNGNLKQVSEAKAKKIAKQCVEYAKILVEELK